MYSFTDYDNYYYKDDANSCLLIACSLLKEMQDNYSKKLLKRIKRVNYDNKEELTKLIDDIKAYFFSVRECV